MFKLMIVDDELLMRIGIRSMIQWEEHGFRIVGEASNGKEALEIAREQLPDLVITDIKMPIMDGLALIREMKKLSRHCKYVILSNFDEFRYVKEALQLGAADYIIKSDIKAEALIELLNVMKRKLLTGKNRMDDLFQLPSEYTQGISFLKEGLFKDVLSGLKGEEELVAKEEQFQIRIRSRELVSIKFRIEQFDEVKKKYREKDEKLLRFSIVNIMEEVIPSKWNKEMIVENSAEYLLLMNTEAVDDKLSRTRIDRLCTGIMTSIKDFMNIRMSVGVSAHVPGYKYIRLACREADLALRYRFFAGSGKVLYFEDVSGYPVRIGKDPLPDREDEQRFLAVLDSNSPERWSAALRDLDHKLQSKLATEEVIRDTYLLLLELVNSKFPASFRPRLAEGEKAPYEAVLTAETWEQLHQVLADYGKACMEVGSQANDQRTYADLAVDIINKYYAEDISLQNVANQINVNPSYLSRIFKQETGENFISFLTRVRIERAKLYLESKSLKVYEVADKVGYHNYTYFSKIFKKVTGVSPEEFRSDTMKDNDT